MIGAKLSGLAFVVLLVTSSAFFAEGWNWLTFGVTLPAMFGAYYLWVVFQLRHGLGS